jgi:hypothetical protein
LTCHFFALFVFELLALDVSALALGVIQPCSETLLVSAAGLATLLEPRLTATVIRVVALAAITAAADIKHRSASQALTDLLAKLAWQGALVFLKAGLDNGRRSWQAMGGSVKVVP